MLRFTSKLFAHVCSDGVFFFFFKSVWARGRIYWGPSVWDLCSSRHAGGVQKDKNKKKNNKRQDVITATLLYYRTPWRPRALCAACVRSPRRSCLCFWKAAGSGACSKTRLGGLRSCRGSVWLCSACSRNTLNGKPGCWQPVSPLGRLSSHMMRTLPSGS